MAEGIGLSGLGCPECPKDCSEAIALPPVQSDRCIQTWDIRKSEGRSIYIAPYNDGTAPFTDAEMQTIATTPDPFISAIDNTAEGGIRCICGVWDLAQPEDTNIRFKGQDILTDRQWTLNFDTIDSNDVLYEFARQASSCPITAWIAFDNEGCSMFGWVQATITGSFEANRGDDSLETIKLTATWSSKCLPPRYDAPETI